MSKKLKTITELEPLESYATWHLNDTDDGINEGLCKAQSQELWFNARQKQEELLKDALKLHLGRLPGQTEARMFLEKIRFEDQKDVNYWYWGQDPILICTEPKSSVTTNKDGLGGRYYLKWAYKILAGNDRN